MFSPLGPLFWGFEPFALQIESDYFDDLHPFFNIVIEYGLLSLLCFLLLIISALKSSTAFYYRPLFFWLLMVLIAPLSNYTPKFYFYAFFSIGALVGARSIFQK